MASVTIEWAVIGGIVGLIALALTLHAKIYARGERDRATAAIAEAAASRAAANSAAIDELEVRVRKVEQESVKYADHDKSMDKMEGRIAQLITTQMQSFSGRLEAVQQMLNAVLSKGSS